MDQSRLLSEYLPKIIKASKKLVPWDIKLDAQEVINKWSAGDFSDDPERGLKKTATGSRTKDPNYTLYRDCNVKGHNGLVVGQWWPLQICAARDGAHGEMEAGIHGSKDKGVLSVVVSGGSDNAGQEYPDDDLGNTLFYCGTRNAQKDGTPTRGTQLLLEAMVDNAVVRVLRSSKHKSKYAPSEGIRYDGLYRVMDTTLLSSEEEQHYRFWLERVENQPPMRFEGEAAKPSRYDLRWRLGPGNILD